MKPATKVLLVCASIIIPLLSASPSFSGVKIELRNGRSIIADSCRKSGGSLVCDKMGGSFRIDEREIVVIKTIEDVETAGRDEGASPAPAETDEKKEAVDDGSAASDGSMVRAGTSSAAGRLEEIRRRKSELVTERDRLAKERQQLQEDVKKAPDWMLPERYSELKKKNEDLDARIKSFNEEVKGLNAEEEKIRGEMPPGSPSPPAEVPAPGQ